MRKVFDIESSGSFPEAVIARTRFHLSQILLQENKNPEEAQDLACIARETLAASIKIQPLDSLDNVQVEHELALFDHLQPVFDGRFTGQHILKYLAE